MKLINLVFLLLLPFSVSCEYALIKKEIEACQNNRKSMTEYYLKKAEASSNSLGERVELYKMAKEIGMKDCVVNYSTDELSLENRKRVNKALKNITYLRDFSTTTEAEERLQDTESILKEIK